MRALPWLLFAVACSAPPAAAPARGPARPPGPLVLDLYDVKDLTVPVRSFPGGHGLETRSEPEEPLLLLEGDALAALVREVIDPDGREADLVVQYREGGILIVKAPGPAHDRIRRFLAGLRKAAAPD